MSKIVSQDNGQVIVRNYFNELCFVASSLNCETHGDTLHITDNTGSDWCVKCLEGMLGAPQ